MIAFTDTWRKVKLGDIVNIFDTKRKPISKSDRVAGEYPYYGANGVQDYVDGYIFDGDYILVGEDGSVITENKTPVVNLASGKFWANNHVHIIDNKKDIVDFKFLYYIIQTSNIAGYVHGNIPKLSQGDLKDIEVYLPSLPEQLQISSILSDYDMLIESERERAKAFLEKQRHSSCRRYSIEYKKVKLGDIAEFINGMAFKPSDWGDTGLPIIRIQNLTGKDKEFNRYNGYVDNKYKIKDGDLLFSWSATLDVFTYRGEDAVLNQHIFKVKSRNGYDIKFIKYLLKMSIAKMMEDAHGVAMKHVTKGTVENLEVNLPPLEHQILISSLLSAYDSLIATVQSEQDSLIKIKSQLMTDIFS